MWKIFCASAALFFVHSSGAFAVDCQFVLDPQTGQYVWTCSQTPGPGHCGWVIDAATGQYIWVCQ